MNGWVLALLSYPTTVALMVASMLTAVVVAAAIEVRTPPRRRFQAARSRVGPPVAGHVAVIDAAADLRGDTAQAAVTPQPATSVTGSATTALVLGPTGNVQDSWIELGPLGIEKEIAGVLFAAYVASGAAEWSRVTGWVTAMADPPSLDGVAARERLRGKPAKVRALLECRDGSRNWVTLDDRTDVLLAIERRAPRDMVLVGLIHWWRLSMSSSPALAPHEVPVLRFGVSAVERELRGHPLASKVSVVIEACRLAEDAGAGLAQQVVSVPDIPSGAGGADGHGGVSAGSAFDGGVSDGDKVVVGERIAG